MKGRSSQKITTPGCSGLPSGSTNLSCCLVQGISTSTCLSCMEIGTGVLGLEVSVTVELLLSEGILLATGDVTGESGTVTGFTGVSGSGVVDIAGCSSMLHIPWLFLEGLPDPVVIFMSVTNLLISLHDAMLFVEVCCQKQMLYYDRQSKTGQYQKFKLLSRGCQSIRSELLLDIVIRISLEYILLILLVQM